MTSIDTDSGEREGAPDTAVEEGFRPLLTEVLFVALTVVFGVQMLRVFLPGLVWLLGDRMGLSEPVLAVIAFAVFIIGFSAGALRGLLGTPLTVIAVAGGLGLTRLLMQIGSGEAGLNVGLAIAGTALFVLFIPAYAGKARLSGGTGMGRFALGLLVGLVLDTALHGAFDTYDMSWQPGALPLTLIALLVVVQWALLAVVTRSRRFVAAREAGINPLALVAVGPFLFLQVVVFQNIARVATLAEWTLPAAFGLTLLAQIAGLGAAACLLSGYYRNLRLPALLLGLVLIAVLAISYPDGAAQTAVQVVFGQFSLSLLVMIAFMAPGGPSKRPLRAVSLSHGLSMILLLLFLLGYYLVYWVSLPYDNTILEPLAAFLVVACVLGSSGSLREYAGRVSRAWLLPVLVLPLLLLPLIGAVTWCTPAAVPGEGYPVRLVTYNLHNGFNAGGHLDMEDIARVIEDQDADIIVLQEVSRGWAMSGRLDMLLWLSQRLDMPYVFSPTADPFWGNAIFSRYPIVEYAGYDLPPRDLPVLRGFTEASIYLGDGDYVRVIATHFHHVEEDTDVRLQQSQRILEGWGGKCCTVLLGDLNADPDEPEMVMLREAGLVDVVAGLEPPRVYTWHARDPGRRIDYIWVTPDMSAGDVHVIFTRASDHLPVVAEIDYKVP
ncbi:endonuclease/exonuclease/phosphatase family protein [Chloroflexota bacterium]